MFVNFVFILLEIKKKNGYFAIPTIFLYTFFLFLLSKYGLDLIGYIDIREADLFSNIYLPIEIIIKTISIYVIVLNFFYMVFSNSTITINIKKWRTNETISKLSFYLMVCLSPLVLFFLLRQLINVLLNGYLSIFNGTLITPIYEQLLFRALYFLYVIIIASKPKKKLFLQSSVLFFLILTLDLLQGQRGLFLSFFTITLSFYFSFYKKKTNITSMLFIFLVFVLVSQSILVLRQSYNSQNLLNAFLDFFNQNGVSTYVISYSIYLQKDLMEITNLFIFSPITDFFYRLVFGRNVFYQGQTFLLLNSSTYLGYHLTYLINRAAFLNGNGTGSSFVAEILLINIPYLINILYFMYFYFIKFINKLALKFDVFRSLFVLLSVQFIYSPRSSYIKSFSDFFLIIIIYTFVALVANFINSKKIIVNSNIL
jgi:hypothetical protein